MATGVTGPEVDVRRFLRTLARRRWLLLAVIVGMTASAYAISRLQQPVYEAEARVLVQPREAEALFDADQTPVRVDPELTIATEIAVLESRPVHETVRRELGPVPKVDATRAGETFLIKVRVRHESRSRATAVADAYARTFVDLRRTQAAGDLMSAADQLRSKITEVQSEITGLDDRVANAPPAARSAATAERDGLVAQLTLFKQRLDEIQVEAALKSGGVQLVAPAFASESPVAPKPVRNAVVAFGLSMLLAVGLVSILEYLGDAVATREELAEAVSPLPVLAAIPAMEGARRHRPRPRSVVDPVLNPAADEAYRGLRTSLQMLRIDRPYQVLQVTSSVGGEGKTTAVANLGVVLAASGQRVVVVDCDLRQPQLHTVFGISGAVGFTSVVAGFANLDDALHDVAARPGLTVLPCGPLAPSPSEMLGSRKTSQVIFELQSRYDVVLIDSAPVLPVTDSTILTAWVDGTLLVVGAGTRRALLKDAIGQLRQVDASVVGAVLNRATDRHLYGYRYGYGYGDRGAAGAEGNGDAAVRPAKPEGLTPNR